MTDSTIRPAYALSRQTDTMDPVRKAFLAAELYVVVKVEPPDNKPAFHAAPSPKKGEMCITVAEDALDLYFIKNVELRKLSGRALLDVMPPAMGVMVMYDQGADYLTRDNLDWFRSTVA